MFAELMFLRVVEVLNRKILGMPRLLMEGKRLEESQK
jgi:hypothetical protein